MLTGWKDSHILTTPSPNTKAGNEEKDMDADSNRCDKHESDGAIEIKTTRNGWLYEYSHCVHCGVVLTKPVKNQPLPGVIQKQGDD